MSVVSLVSLPGPTRWSHFWSRVSRALSFTAARMLHVPYQARLKW